MTFSLLARCPETGQYGVIVASRVLAVATRVIAARAGVGAAVTQAGSWTHWGQSLLDAQSAGLSPTESIALLADAHDLCECQVAVIGADGVDAFTGGDCIPAAGHLVAGYGQRTGSPQSTPGWVSVQGNTLASRSVCDAMLDGFLTCDGALVERLVAGLQAGDDAGGDARGRQSAAVLVVPGEVRTSEQHLAHTPTGAWDDPFVDLRVDDDPDAVAVLAHLVRTHEQHRGFIRASCATSHAEALLSSKRPGC